MPTLTHLASRYRWELMLLVGIPITEQTFWWLLPHILGNFNIAFDIWSREVWSLSPFLRPFLNISLILLGIFYFHVRLLGRTTLSLLWAFAFVSEAVATAVGLPSNLIDHEWWLEVSSAPWWVWWVYTGNWWRSWWNTVVPVIPQIMVLVWFARQASRISFGHALVFIGLAIAFSSTGLRAPIGILGSLRVGYWDFVIMALTLQLFAVWVLSRLDAVREPHETDIERWIGSWDIPGFGAALRRLAVRVLPRFDPVRGISKELLVALFGLNCLLNAFVRLRYSIGVDFETAILVIRDSLVYSIVFWPLSVALVILLAYAVRVRQPPRPPSVPVPTGST